jgi:hypothetical protein
MFEYPSKYPEGVLFKKIHSQEEQKRINIEIRRSTTVPLRESVSSLCRGHANLLEAGAPSLSLSGSGCVATCFGAEWLWLAPEDFLCRQPEIETLSIAYVE